MWLDKKACLNAHGIDGLNKLTELLRPHLELRGFYFGARSVIMRECVPAEDTSSVYSQLREISLDKHGEIIALDFTPIKKQVISRITYVGDKRSQALTPLTTPRKGGDHDLAGFFSKESYCAALYTFQDLIKLLGFGHSEFHTLKVKCDHGHEARLIRDVEEVKEGIRHSYKIFCKDCEGKEIQSEAITFLVSKNVRA